MLAATRLRNPNEVDGVIEQAVPNSSRRSARGDPLPAIPAVERIAEMGTMSARAIIETCEATARDIERAGQSAMDLATEVMREARQLAMGLRANGRKMSEHLEGFAVLAEKVSTAMRDTRAEVFGPSSE